MVYDASLGYDPDEWEECPVKEHVMVFSFFTRLLLSTIAVAFVVFFYHLVDNNNNKEKNKKKEDAEPEPTSNIIAAAARKLEEYLKTKKDEVEEFVQNGATAEDLLQEAQDYMQEMKANAIELGKKVEYAAGAAKETFTQFIEEPRRRTEAEPSPEGSPHPGRWDHQHVPQESGGFGQLSEQWTQPSQPRATLPPVRKISREDEQALFQWELERQKLEAERLAKLQDHEVGGDESEQTSGFLPASHISFPSHSTGEGNLNDIRAPDQSANGLERKLASEIERIAEAAPTTKRESYRDSELTDYDISDFHRDENHEHGAPIANAHFIALEAAQPTVEANFPAAVDSATRHTTGDSDEYVKVHADPIYDMPPRGEKAMSPEEAKQLQELCQEYDFGMDMGPDGPTPPQSFPINSQFSPPAFQSATHQAPRFVPQEIPQEAPRPPPRQIIRDAQRLQTGEVSENNDKNVHKVPIKLLRLENAECEDPKNIVNAEMYVSDALEYLGNQQAHSPTGAFVMEEDMLSSHGSQKRPEQYVRLPSGDPTSHQIKTMEVFERVEHDDHDDITYAPEIQSVEIPPDQMSENSENLQEYFDRAAAEGALEAKLREMKPISAQQAARGQAPHIVSASGNRANSNSSLASGRSGRSSSDGFPKLRKQSSLLSVMGVTSMQEILLTIDSLDTLSDAMRKAGLENTNMIFGIDYTASNKYQGEDSFGGRSLHTIHPNIMNPYQQVITILGRTLAPFASTGCIPLYGFGDAKTGDWSVFPLKQDGDCRTLEEVLKIYNEVTPTVDLSGPTNFAPLIYQAMEICQKANDYHILVIIADGQVTNERATRRAIVQACQYPLSIIVVGVGDGPWEMMRVFDESLPKRPWDNFHFTEFHEIMRRASGQAEGDVKLAVQSLLEIPDQYRCICELGLLKNRSIPPRGSEIRKEILSK